MKLAPGKARSMMCYHLTPLGVPSAADAERSGRAKHAVTLTKKMSRPAIRM